MSETQRCEDCGYRQTPHCIECDSPNLTPAPPDEQPTTEERAKIRREAEFLRESKIGRATCTPVSTDLSTEQGEPERSEPAEVKAARQTIREWELRDGHTSYVDCLDGGYRGYQAACWDCDWRGPEHLRTPGEDMNTPHSRSHKIAAKQDAAEHRRLTTPAPTQQVERCWTVEDPQSYGEWPDHWVAILRGPNQPSDGEVLCLASALHHSEQLRAEAEANCADLGRIAESSRKAAEEAEAERNRFVTSPNTTCTCEPPPVGLRYTNEHGTFWHCANCGSTCRENETHTCTGPTLDGFYSRLSLLADGLAERAEEAEGELAQREAEIEKLREAVEKAYRALTNINPTGIRATETGRWANDALTILRSALNALSEESG